MNLDRGDKFLVTMAGLITINYLLTNFGNHKTWEQVFLVIASIGYGWMAIKIWLVKTV